MLVTYDVKTDHADGPTRLRRVARACKDYGQRVQFSVFECEVDPAQWVELRARLVAAIDQDHDSLRFYRIGSNWRERVEHVGAKPAIDFDEPMIW